MNELTEPTAQLLDVPNDLYHQMTDIVSCSMAKVALDSFSDYAALYVHKTKPQIVSTKAMDLGSVADAVVLERKPCDELVSIYPQSCLKSDGAINPKPAREWESTMRLLGTKYFFKECDGERLKAIIEALQTSFVGEWLNSPQAVTQKAIFWTDEESGLSMRCKPDLFIDALSGVVFAFDLKTSVFYTPSEFRRRVRVMRYWLQQSIYSKGLQAKFPGRDVEFRFIVVNPDPPHQVALYRLDEQSVDASDTRCRELLLSLAARYRDNNWLDTWQNNDNELSLSKFDF